LDIAVKKIGAAVYFPEMEFCTDNGAMIAYAGAMRLRHGGHAAGAFSVRPRWDLETMEAPLQTTPHVIQEI